MRAFNGHGFFFCALGIWPREWKSLISAFAGGQISSSCRRRRRSIDRSLPCPCRARSVPAFESKQAGYQWEGSRVECDFFERKGCEKQPRESRNFLRKLASPSRYFQAAVFSRPIERYLSVTGINVSCNKGGGKKPRGNNRAPSRNTTPHWVQGPLGVGYFHTLQSVTWLVYARILMNPELYSIFPWGQI